MTIQGKIYTKFVMTLNKLAKTAIKADREYDSINDINLEEIIKLKKEYGIGGIILDVDGTILYNLEYIPEQVKKTLEMLRKEFKIYIVSNNKSKQVEDLAKKLGISYLPFAMKPRRKPFIKASNEMGLDPENIIVIGDGFLTDIFGGKRTNMYTGVIKNEIREEEER